MNMVRRWAIFRVEDDAIVLASGHPSQGIAAMEALRLASETGITHRVAEQIAPWQVLLAQIDRARHMRGY